MKILLQIQFLKSEPSAFPLFVRHLGVCRSNPISFSVR